MPRMSHFQPGSFSKIGLQRLSSVVVELVADADRNLIEIAECIKYGHGNAGCTLHLAPIAGCNEVEPADTTRTAGGSTVLALIAAALSQLFRFIAENLGNELACADSAGIRLNDRVNLFDLIRRDAACTDSAEAGDRGGGGDHRINAEVRVLQGAEL